MTPDKLAKSGTEHAHQVALFAYCAVARTHGFTVADHWCDKGPVAFKISSYSHGGSIAYPELDWLHAIPNGGSRGDSEKSRQIRGAALKAEGVRPGIADVFLPYPNGGYHGLYIEMKKPSQKPKREDSKGGMSEVQLNFKKYCIENNYGFKTCYSWREAVTIIRSYLEWS